MEEDQKEIPKSVGCPIPDLENNPDFANGRGEDPHAKSMDTMAGAIVNG